MLRDAGVGQHIAYALQLGLGGVFALSFALKARRPRAFVRTVSDYRLLPSRLAPATGGAVLLVEAGVAFALLSGTAIGGALAVAAASLCAFGIAVTVNLRRGRTVPCGCFGSDTELISARSVARIVLLLAGVALLAALVASPGVVAVSAGDVADQPSYLADTAGVAVVMGVAAVWVLNARGVAAVLDSFRAEPDT